MSLVESLEAGSVIALQSGLGVLPWRRAIEAGGAMGVAACRAGLRRRVARDNLAHAFPERSPAERDAIMRGCYRTLGRIAAEYPRMPVMARAPLGEFIAGIRGFEHIEGALAAGRGAVLLGAHFGHVELACAALAQRVPASVVVQRQSNRRVDAWLTDLRARAGLGIIPLGAGSRAILRELRSNRCVALLADQDARQRGVFVPFFGRSASTPRGPAELALRTGAPLIMGFMVRNDDLRHELHVLPPIEARSGADPHEELMRLTVAHVGALERWVRAHPDHWFWVHRRWKTAPPA